MNTEILIIGGGISGLHTAYQLQKRGIDFLLVEARDRLGGRILSNNYELSTQRSSSNQYQYDLGKPAYDLGPSWFWPGQNHIHQLINDLDLTESVFHQEATGQSVYEDQQGNIQKGFYGISMEGAYRINGGMQQLIACLELSINKENILKSAQVTSIAYSKDHIQTKINNSSEVIEVNSNKVVIALPPRLAMSSIEFSPALKASKINELNSYATWMAGHAKIIVSYEKPFWLEQDLSGDAVSHLGPMREIHDASSDPDKTKTKKGYAIFGFVGIPGSYRKGKESEIKKAAIEQLIRLFGEKARNPIDVVLKDWAQEKFTATESDFSMSGGHATASITNYTEEVFKDNLIWSGTETASHLRGFNGLIEGALEASDRTVSLLTS